MPPGICSYTAEGTEFSCDPPPAALFAACKAGYDPGFAGGLAMAELVMSKTQDSSVLDEAGPWYSRPAWTPWILAGIVLLSFISVLSCDFVNLDDLPYVRESRYVTDGLRWSSVWGVLTTRQLSLYHPLASLTFLVDYTLFELEPMGYHAVNLLIHIASVVLLFRLLRTLTGSHWRSALAALLVGVHPLRVESVAWIAERKDLLFFFFAMVTFLAYVHYARRPGVGRYLLMVPPFVLSLMAKPMLMTLPALLLLLDYWPMRRWRGQQVTEGRFAVAGCGRLIMEKVPLGVIGVGWVLAVMFVAPVKGPTTRPVEAAANALAVRLPADPMWRAGNAMVSYVRYLVKTVDVGHLSCYYAPVQWRMGQVAGAVAVLVAITTGVVLLRRRRPELAFAWLWFVLALLPVIGITQISGYSLADRYTYLPAVGLMVGVVWLLPGSWARARWAQAALAVVILASCILTSRQVQVWHDSVSLWRNALAVDGDTWIAHNNLGSSLNDVGELDAAEEEYHAALRVVPEHPLSVANLKKVAKVRRVLERYRPRIEANPNDYEARCGLVDDLIRMGQPTLALIHARELLAAFPDAAYVQVRVGVAMYQLGHYREAVASYRRALAAEPDMSDALANLGRVYARWYDDETAVQYYERALKSDPGAAAVYANMGLALSRLGRHEEGMVHLRTSLRLNPNSARTHNNIAAQLLADGDYAGAAAEAKESLRLFPNNGEGKDLLKQAKEHLPATEATTAPAMSPTTRP